MKIYSLYHLYTLDFSASNLMEGTEILGAFAIRSEFSINFIIHWPTSALIIFSGLIFSLIIYNDYMHILAADGFFYVPSINIDTASLEKIFIHKILKMLMSKGLITQRVIELVSSWQHSGFGVYCGKRINPKDARSTENMARYIMRASFSQERMKYYPVIK